jgi:hypothetical protein
MRGDKKLLLRTARFISHQLLAAGLRQKLPRELSEQEMFTFSLWLSLPICPSIGRLMASLTF